MPEPNATGRLTGSSAVVTGASRGIGLAIARALAADGVRVAMIARGEDVLRREADAIGSNTIPIACDVSRSDAVSRAVSDIVRAFAGAPSILVNNAGAFTVTGIDDLDPSSFSAALDTNLVAPLRFIHAFLPEMRARKQGHIVTVGSIADRTVLPGNASYAPGKFGARALHEVLRLETRGSGVRATLVSPGPVDTSLWDAIEAHNRAGFTPRAEMLRATAVADALMYVLTQPTDVNVDELRLSHS